MRAWTWKRWLVIAIVAGVVLVVGGPYVYFNFVQGDAPDPLGLSSPSPTSTPAGQGGSTGTIGETNGVWTVTDGAVVGYRIEEVLFGQSNEAVGRTSSITGSVTVRGTTIPEGAFTVDMTTVTSDEDMRDEQFHGRIMETGTYPTATFTLTDPIDLGSIPGDGEERTYEATGELTLHGVTRSVTFEVTGRITGSTFEVAGQIPITFADWNIENPSFGPVTTEDHGTLEFSLRFLHE
jgi:polyisoprenoid-binding protein YceI